MLFIVLLLYSMMCVCISFWSLYIVLSIYCIIVYCVNIFILEKKLLLLGGVIIGGYSGDIFLEIEKLIGESYYIID